MITGGRIAAMGILGILGILLVILFWTRVRNWMKQTKTDEGTYKKFVHDEKDTTDAQKEIHRKAGESEYWARRDMSRGLYA